MAFVLYVRLKSGLNEGDLQNKLMERKPQFLKVPGLIQKIYGRDKATGYACGIYFFESEKALEDFAGSELARTIPEAYEVVEIRKEVYECMFPLRPETGPLP
ncbi:MAG: YdhR family protein [Nitrospinota bacterium]|nr:YdhR family protein [Nitrospinota bacterium]